jgi:hypothetical protein
MAWRLRSNPEDITNSLRDLEGLIVHLEGQIWVVTKFKDRQFSESYERVKRYRNRYNNKDGNEEETEKESSSSSPSPSDSYSLEGGGAGEETKPASYAFVPDTPKQAGSHPDIRTYINVSGRFPGQRDYPVIIDTIQALREKHGDDLETILAPYWYAWSSRKTKDNKPYSPASLVWLCEWAMQGEIPKANGHEPKAGEDRKSIIRQVAGRKVANAR